MYKILKFSYTPKNIIFPIPVLPLIVGLIGGGIGNFWKPIIITFLFYPAINLWNHLNDADDDYKAGKDTPFINEALRKRTIVLVFFLYLSSGLIAYEFGGVSCLTFFIIVFIATFLYSDNMLFKIRLKGHYFWELVVYLISVPAYILMMYSSVSDVDSTGILLSVTFLPLMLSTVFVKDLKDISADREAGLKTLGVKFRPEILVKSFSILVLIYFITIVKFYGNSIYVLSELPVPFAVAGFIYLAMNGWEISKATIKYYLLIFYSGLFSVFLFLVAAVYDIFI
ncbi:UbiA family prenyltransferase [Geoglobus sp.]